MCGITGFSRHPHSSIPDGRDFIVAGLLSIENRGHHATGVGWSERGDSDHVWYAKLQGRASKVARKLALPERGIHTAVGHTRWATLGDPAVEGNNHPVVHNNIVAVHNGVLDNHTELLGLCDVTNPAEVDSFAIAALLASARELGADHPTELLTEIRGCAAVAWLDADENDVLHLARCATRPLTIGWTRRGDLCFASTRQSLEHQSDLTRVGIRQIEHVPEGTYLRVERGVIVERKRFAVPRSASSWRSEDVPTKPKSVTTTRPKVTPQRPDDVPSQRDGQLQFRLPRIELGPARQERRQSITDLFDTPADERDEQFWADVDAVLGKRPGGTK